MKKLLFVLPILAMIFVGCANPTDGSIDETPVEKTPVTTPETTPADVSPYEYVKPACVNLADYTYVGDYIFADSMNFAEWMYANATTNYLLAFEKIARVKNDNPATQIVRYPHNATSEEDAFNVVKATKYKIYVNNERIAGKTVGQNVFNCFDTGLEGTYDGSQIMIRKSNNDTFTITSIDGRKIDDYVAY